MTIVNYRAKSMFLLVFVLNPQTSNVTNRSIAQSSQVQIIIKKLLQVDKPVMTTIGKNHLCCFYKLRHMSLVFNMITFY